MSDWLPAMVDDAACDRVRTRVRQRIRRRKTARRAGLFGVTALLLAVLFWPPASKVETLALTIPAAPSAPEARIEVPLEKKVPPPAPRLTLARYKAAEKI